MTKRNSIKKVRTRIQAVFDSLKDVDEAVHVALDGNGVSATEACVTMQWVLKILNGEETTELTEPRTDLEEELNDES